MRDLSKRSTEDELMDDPYLSEDKLNAALDDISMINKWLGGNAVTVSAIKKTLKEYPDKKKWTIADVGCGDGEMLRILQKELALDGYDCTYTGIDISEKGLERARRLTTSNGSITYVNDNIFDLVSKEPQFDIVISTLTLHHIRDKTIIEFVRAMLELSEYCVIINDLHRNRTAYMLYKVFSRIFIKSEVAKYDGLVSIASAFKRKDLESYAQKLRLTNHKITWKWAFRYLWYIKTI